MTRTCPSTMVQPGHGVRPNARGGRPRADAALVRLFDTLLAWQERANQRHHLRSLSDYMLRDVGLSRADLEAEASKPFWRP